MLCCQSGYAICSVAVCWVRLWSCRSSRSRSPRAVAQDDVTDAVPERVIGLDAFGIGGWRVEAVGRVVDAERDSGVLHVVGGFGEARHVGLVVGPGVLRNVAPRDVARAAGAFWSCLRIAVVVERVVL